jgi:hypothetical protein
VESCAIYSPVVRDWLARRSWSIQMPAGFIGEYYVPQPTNKHFTEDGHSWIERHAFTSPAPQHHPYLFIFTDDALSEKTRVHSKRKQQRRATRPLAKPPCGYPFRANRVSLVAPISVAGRDLAFHDTPRSILCQDIELPTSATYTVTSRTSCVVHVDPWQRHFQETS